MSVVKPTGEVLHVDDDPATLRLVNHLLTKRGYQVESLADPREAMRRLELTGTRVVLLDVNMPHTSGMQILREIQAYGGYIPVIMLTGMLTQFTLTEALSHGADSCLFKPIKKPEKLYEAVASAFRKLDRWRELLLELNERKLLATETTGMC